MHDDGQPIAPVTVQIKGYRQLTNDEQSLINEAKTLEVNLAAFCERVLRTDGDPRSVSMARSHFQDGFMRLVRSVAKPVSPWGEF